MADWTVVVRLDSKVPVSHGVVRRSIENASLKRGGRVSQSEFDLVIAVPDRESAEGLARDVRRVDGVLDAYSKPPVALP